MPRRHAVALLDRVSVGADLRLQRAAIIDAPLGDAVVHVVPDRAHELGLALVEFDDAVVRGDAGEQAAHHGGSRARARRRGGRNRRAMRRIGGSPEMSKVGGGGA